MPPIPAATSFAVIVGLLILAHARLISWRRFAEATGGVMIGGVLVSAQLLLAASHG